MKLFLNVISSIVLLFVLVACLGKQNDYATENLNQFEAVVTKVSDGDTIWVKDQHGLKRKLRLANIDAPELSQAYGQASKNFLKQLIDGQKVSVLVLTKDRYKRDVVIVSYKKQDINLKQVENGMAWHYISIAKGQQTNQQYKQYAKAQQNAQQQSLGLWGKKDAIEPWVFRREFRQQQK